ncbi:hypothetical protein ONZ51_g5388 [Trametes cubensis]|uniref:Uncharacterized protein n=1 Tax=Trametes cubensis TaxID=1111947 RepID=A0AAD7TUA6_9APHY|nr:hypothetical protein ONZ51_g5388 [Trametes cubensis]
MLARADVHLQLLLALLSVLMGSGFAPQTSVSATSANVTIDDTYGDEFNGAQIAYSPEDSVSSWNLGVAVYVFCTVPTLSGFDSAGVGSSDMSFFVDGTEVGQYAQAPNADGFYSYNVPVFVMEGLSAGQHQLTIVNGRAGGFKSVMFLDYIKYTPIDRLD